LHRRGLQLVDDGRLELAHQAVQIQTGDARAILSCPGSICVGLGIEENKLGRSADNASRRLFSKAGRAVGIAPMVPDTFLSPTTATGRKAGAPRGCEGAGLP
jgi:hypothetical protein